jgi:hypothetical protein
MRAARVEMLSGDDWRALVGVRRDLNLLATWTGRYRELAVEAWAGEPKESDAVAVIDTGDGVLRLARVPLCSCGDRGCGNAGIQLSKCVAAGELPALVGLLRELPWTRTIPTSSNVLHGGGLAAMAIPDTDLPTSGYLYLGTRETGVSFPLRPQERDSKSDP